MNRDRETESVLGGTPRRGGWRWLEFVGFPVVALAVAVYLHFSMGRVHDLDGLWHLRHAWVYRTYGLLYADFPWLTASVVSQYRSDDWYGFHLLLIPFTLFQDPWLRIRIGGAFLTFCALLLAWWGLRLMRVRGAWLWPWLMLLASPATAGRYSVIRPHVLSNVLALLLVPVFLRGKLWQIALLGFLFTWIHFNVWWMLPLLAAMTVIVLYMTERRPGWGRFLILLAGMTAGWLLRPNPLGAAKLVYVQTFALLQARMAGVPLVGAREMVPMDLSFLQFNFIPLTSVWLAGLGLWLFLYWRRRWTVAEPQRALLWSCLVLSLLFFEMAVALGRRASDQWVLFAVGFLALLTTVAWGRPATHRWLHARAWVLPLVVVLASGLVVGNSVRAVRWSQASTNHVMPDSERLRPACAALEALGRAGTIVFCSHWEFFPELFFWNPTQYYITGIDSVFQYAYSQDLFWKTLHLQDGPGDVTCGQPKCTPENSEDTYTVLRRDFRASYVLVDKGLDRNLWQYLQRDPRFRLRYEDAAFAVYELGG